MKEENDFWSHGSLKFNQNLSKELINIQRKMKRGWEKTLLEEMEKKETEIMISLISHKLTQEEDSNFSEWKIEHDYLLEYYVFFYIFQKFFSFLFSFYLFFSFFRGI